MMPRYYTIASSAKLSPTKVRIAISLSDYNSPKGKRFFGITSEYLHRIFSTGFDTGSKPDAASRIFIKDSLFKYPEDPKTPVVMCGPGTGVVPFIAFAEDRQYLKANDADIELGDATLFFGCKEDNEDYIYKEEISEFLGDNRLSKVHEAFSRQQDKKVYVQDLIRENAEQVREALMDKNGQFFICGAMEMGKAVEKLLEEIFGDGGEDYLKKMKTDKRFAKELWSS